MKCRECEKAIYTYRELSERERQQVDMHVQSCHACRKAMTEMQKVTALVQKASVAAPTHSNPEWLTNKIMASMIINMPMGVSSNR